MCQADSSQMRHSYLEKQVSSLSDGEGLAPGLDITERSTSSLQSLASLSEATDSDSECASIEEEKEVDDSSFNALRINYLFVILSIMLADGLQGTHLYVLYEGYGFSVASLYSLGFITGAVTTPLTGSLVDKFGRKASALWYCILEISINQLEQYPFLAGLIVSRMVGGITTNLLSTVFEAWLDTEYRKRGLPEEKYEIIMRDSVIVSNLAAIASGWLAHVLAENYGPVGPFKGAVSCTTLALVVVASLWTENYGKAEEKEEEKSNDKSLRDYVSETVTVFRNDSKVLRVGIVQGLTVGCLQIFIFLWSPTLAAFAKSSNSSHALDSAGEPAYGLIFGSYMAAGVCGGLASPYLRKAVSCLLSPVNPTEGETKVVTEEGEEEVVRPMAVEFMASMGYVLGALLLFVPVMLDPNNENSFSISLGAFLIYEFLVGVIMPCEGIIRSLYLPSDCRATIMTLPRMIVNIQVSVAVILTNTVKHQTAFCVIAFLMAVAAVLQMSLISKREWESLYARAEHSRRKSLQITSKALRRASSCLSLGSSLLEEEKIKDE